MVSKLKIRNPIRRLNFFLKTIIMMIIICPSHGTSGCPLEHYVLEWNMGFPFMFSCSYVLMFSCSQVLMFSCSHVFTLFLGFQISTLEATFRDGLGNPNLFFKSLMIWNSPPISTLSPPLPPPWKVQVLPNKRQFIVCKFNYGFLYS